MEQTEHTTPFTGGNHCIAHYVLGACYAEMNVEFSLVNLTEVVLDVMV